MLALEKMCALLRCKQPRGRNQRPVGALKLAYRGMLMSGTLHSGSIVFGAPVMRACSEAHCNVAGLRT